MPAIRAQARPATWACRRPASSSPASAARCPTAGSCRIIRDRAGQGRRARRGALPDRALPGRRAPGRRPLGWSSSPQPALRPQRLAAAGRAVVRAVARWPWRRWPICSPAGSPRRSRLFADAAERLGRDPRARRWQSTGPPRSASPSRAFNDMQERLRRYVEDRTAMVGAIAHDLRTPLTRLRFRIEGLPEDQRAKMTADIDQMEEMISAALTFVRDATPAGRAHAAGAVVPAGEPVRRDGRDRRLDRGRSPARRWCSRATRWRCGGCSPTCWRTP